MLTQQKLQRVVLITAVSLGLLPGSAMSQVINFVGANAGSVMASVPSNNNFVQSGNGLLANGTTWGPSTQTLSGGAWSDFQANRSVTVENTLNIYSGYSYARTSFTAGASGQINPSVVHTFNLHNELLNRDICCGISSDSRGDVTFRFEVTNPTHYYSGAHGGWVYDPVPIYFVYEWDAEEIRGAHAPCCGANTAHTTTGWMPAGNSYNYWTEPQMPHYESINTGTWSGSRSGVFYIGSEVWGDPSQYPTLRDFRFVFENQLGGAGSWSASSMDMNIRLAFSDQPFTSIPTVTPTSPVPEPEAYGMLLAGLGLLSFTTRRRKQGA